ncbi:polyphosphate polymerase domain-containing protein [Enterococcus saccharolyticus]|uniref:polyphosphate polymerase domain-containing protein n=1 Tax=Enterococcus TaxID=1350 RepID=UPI001E38E8E6|nr:polyphosphate polymerase domain-containing protein [Enterococcus saccharolyticus]MCD5003538.1 polyphosphate polymerase domain-containing protein [Enterococcus saccharolyticus]
MKLKKVFQRKETKYLLNQTQFANFLEELQQYMQIDQYGLHTIRSLYYDTTDYQFIHHSMDKPKYKEKFRIRSYGTPSADCLIFLEIKKKVKGIVYKRRLPMTYREYLTWVPTNQLPQALATSQIGQEIHWLFLKHPDLNAKVLISYDRLSLFDEKDENFRVTFDQNIRFQSKTPALEAERGELVAPELDVLMEVKAMGAYPLWFVNLLTKYHIQKSSFSKYAQTYQRHLFTEELFYVV